MDFFYENTEAEFLYMKMQRRMRTFFYENAEAKFL